MSVIESKAVFSARAVELGVGDLVEAMAERGWDTMGSFAFSSSWVPGAGDDAAFKADVLVPLLGAEPTAEAKNNLPNISRKIAQCVTVLAQTAEMLKGQDWVDPDDPMLIAENELLGAAQSIEKAAKKLSTLKPRKEVTGHKVKKPAPSII